MNQTTDNQNYTHTVCVYCASSGAIAPVYVEAAGALGTLLAQNGWRVINGAGPFGLMRVVSDAVLRAGGKVKGIIPRFMVENGWCHNALEDVEITENIHERKQQMATLSDAAVALPGGCGTLEELLEIITWKQLGLYSHPLVILNTNHYYDALLAMLQHAVDERFMSPQYATIWQVATTPEEVIQYLKTGFDTES